MKKIALYQVDAFTDRLFGGNPAGVCPLGEWLPESLMQSIAMENNLAETAFFVPQGDGFHIRWFTPLAEVDLCGHATLASSHVIFQYLGWKKPEIHFHSRSGVLVVRKDVELLTLNFPADSTKSVLPPVGLLESLGIQSSLVLQGKTDYLILLPSQADVEGVSPDFGLLGKVDCRGVMITAPGTDADFVSRFFAPKVGVNEDPVTGSAHTTLIPFWAKRLGKSELTAIQLSKRRGHLWCKFLGDRVEMSGKAVTYLVGEIMGG
jgi:PhzF family phenazine biosynthesis protein